MNEQNNQPAPPGPLDYLTRIDNLLVANLEAIKELGDLTRIGLGPEKILDLVEQRKQAESGQWTPYAIKSFSLTAARTDELVTVEGDFLHAYTDGAYTGIGVRFNHQQNDLVYFERHNPIYGPRFWKLFLTNTAQAGKTLDLMIGRESSASSGIGVSNFPKIQEVIIYPVAEDAGVTEAADDGTSPAYYPAAAHSTAANAEASPGVAWSEDIDLEQEGAITIISIYFEFEWQTRFLIGAGAGTQSSSKIQISRDGGTTWVDVTDNFNNTAATMTNRIRAAVGAWITTLVAGANQLQFRLVHWTDDAGAVATSEAQIRSNSYVRLSYRKS